MKKIAFIVRGNLDNPDLFRSNISRLFNTEFEIFLKFTRSPGHAIDIVEELLEKEHVNFIIAVGGDGTFSEVINGYMKAPLEARSKAILTVFPRGAGNDFNRSAGRINSMEHLYERIAANEYKPLDVVQVKYTEEGEEKIRYYDNSFDIGLGGAVCQFVNNSNKTWGSNLTYFYNILRSFLLFKRVPIKLTSPELNFEGKVLLIALNNGRFFGSGLCLSPNAKLDDGKVDVVIIRKINIFQFLLHLPSLKREKRIKHREIFYHKLSECTIESSKTDFLMELDGEVIGKLPLKLSVKKHAAKILKI